MLTSLSEDAIMNFLAELVFKNIWLLALSVLSNLHKGHY